MSTATYEHSHGEHPHEHSHEHSVEADVVESNQHHGPSYDGSVVLEIGGSIGAVILTVPAELAGLEIDIEGVGRGTTSTHSLVRPRIVPGQTVYAAVYPGLPEGAYRVAATAGHPATDVEVVGGRAAKIDWT